MRRRGGSASVALILVALGLLGVIVVALSWWRLPNVGSSDGEMRAATAKVIESAPCGPSARGDLVEVRVDGETRQLRLDGCGHTSGQTMQVQIPADGGEHAVRAGESDDSGGLHARASWVLSTLAAIAGGGYALLITRPRALS
ncbi:hypothetical protein [Saccharopolyspora gloriosae]|uniref:Uncharacterized protein n=1 Tax=Saccharopolyspora gloriosae TaxID=455344 RepID=A0A840NDU1_9PSEU|nr:hypothetical protein [Saccharopolyspora gloriosae]